MCPRRAALALSVIATMSVAGRARADGEVDPRVIAEQLFDDGRALLEAKRYPEACAKLAESQRLDPGGGTLLNLGICRELEGKTASAWAVLRDALGQAVSDKRSDREEVARAHLARLEPRL